jgi:hypothetical protein
MQDDLEALFGRKVDLVERAAVEENENGHRRSLQRGASLCRTVTRCWRSPDMLLACQKIRRLSGRFRDLVVHQYRRLPAWPRSGDRTEDVAALKRN